MGWSQVLWLLAVCSLCLPRTELEQVETHPPLAAMHPTAPVMDGAKWLPGLCSQGEGRAFRARVAGTSDSNYPPRCLPIPISQGIKLTL